MNAPDEAVTWRLALAGDGDAFGLIFDAHSGRVYRHARRLTNGVHDAEDVLGAAFLELWRRREDVRVVDGSVLPWLLVTTLALGSLISTAAALTLGARATVEYRRTEPSAVAPLLRVLAARVWLVLGATPGWFTTSWSRPACP